MSAISAGAIFSSSLDDDEEVQGFTSRDAVRSATGYTRSRKTVLRKNRITERKRCGRKRRGEIVGTHENSAANRTWRDSVLQKRFVRIKLPIESLVRSSHRCSSQ